MLGAGALGAAAGAGEAAGAAVLGAASDAGAAGAAVPADGTLTFTSVPPPPPLMLMTPVNISNAPTAITAIITATAHPALLLRPVLITVGPRSDIFCSPGSLVPV